MADVKELPLGQLRLDGGTQVRARLDQSAVNEYAAMIQDGSAAPPIDVFFDGADYWVASGFHRIEAHRKAGLGIVPATIHHGGLAAAKVFAAGSNANHGVRRTKADIERAFAILMESGWGDRSVNAIRKHLKVTAETVNAMRADYDSKQQDFFEPPVEEDEPELEEEQGQEEDEPERRVVQKGDGTTYSMRTDNIGRHHEDKKGERALKAGAKALGVLQDHLQTANWEIAGREGVPCLPQIKSIQSWIDSHKAHA